jgi:uncharacterized Zn-finger protein
MSGIGYPKFRNDRGVPEICIGVKKFECIGMSPPHDHPHIYIDMREADAILCPYCATRFRFDPRLTPLDADPPDSIFTDHNAAWAEPLSRRQVTGRQRRWRRTNGTRVGSTRDDRQRRGLGSFRADIAC